MTMADILLSIISCIISGVISWGLSAWYYKKANNDAVYSEIVLPLQLTDDCNLYRKCYEVQATFAYNRILSSKSKRILDNISNKAMLIHLGKHRYMASGLIEELYKELEIPQYEEVEYLDGHDGKEPRHQNGYQLEVELAELLEQGETEENEEQIKKCLIEYGKEYMTDIEYNLLEGIINNMSVFKAIKRSESYNSFLKNKEDIQSSIISLK